jgi:hypothetical protein
MTCFNRVIHTQGVLIKNLYLYIAQCQTLKSTVHPSPIKTFYHRTPLLPKIFGLYGVLKPMLSLEINARSCQNRMPESYVDNFMEAVSKQCIVISGSQQSGTEGKSHTRLRGVTTEEAFNHATYHQIWWGLAQTLRLPLEGSHTALQLGQIRTHDFLTIAKPTSNGNHRCPINQSFGRLCMWGYECARLTG